MARIPYADPNQNDEVKALADQIKQERGFLEPGCRQPLGVA